MVAAVSFFSVCCQQSKGRPLPVDAATTAVRDGGHAAGLPAMGSESTALIPAARCGECHGGIESEWRSSRHAESDTSPLYRALRTRSGSQQCDRCHAPLRALAPGDPIAQEGVGCDVCHTMSRIDITKTDGTGFVIHPEDSVRFGPLCDSQPHYFHRMGCSTLHSESAFCSGCHNWKIAHPQDPPLSLLPEYEEWLAAPSPVGTMECQNCHMPSERREVAVGSSERIVHGHRFSLRGALLGRALRGKAEVSVSQGKIRVRLLLTNSGAGHAVPTGFPERQLRVGVRVLDHSGRIVEDAVHSYGRTFVDGQGRRVAFYLAARADKDTRIQAGETREDLFVLTAPLAGQIMVSVSKRQLTEELAAQLGIELPPDAPMLSGQVSLPLPQTSKTTTVVLTPAS